MKKSFNVRRIFLCIAIIAVCVFACFDYIEPLLNKSNKMSYRDFYSQVADGKVKSADIKDSAISFVIGNQKFVTENPDSPTLKEYLLINGVEVSEKSGSLQIISLFFDLFFYALFFTVFIFAFRKFISPNTFKVVRNTGVTFDKVVGMDTLKKYMTQVIDIMKHSEEYAKKGIRAPKGIIMEGDPGNGKTLFAKALAGEAKINFIPAKATDFESMFMAIGPMKVKLLFSKARRKAPCIVFIDEFDGIGTKRNYSGSAIETENTRIVTALLNELDGFEANKGILVLAATNSIRALDEALIRPGRFDLRVQVPYPSSEDRIKLCEMYMSGKMYDSDCTAQKLADLFNGFSAAKIESCINGASLYAGQQGRLSFNLSDVRAVL